MAGRYEKADGRRKVIPEYLLRNLGQFKYDGSFNKLLWVTERILDIGSGTGFWMGKGRRPLKNVVAYDISENMLKEIKADCLKVCGDAYKLPFKDGIFDKVICISTLHHLREPEAILLEVKRVLKPKGIFYSDLDLDWKFAKRFKIPLAIYRWIRNAPARFGVSKELYEATEVGREGLVSVCLMAFLKRFGFSEIKIIYHWGDGKPWPRGFAPLVSIWAVKLRSPNEPDE